MEGKEKEREIISVWLPFACPLLRTQPATQALSLTGNQTGDPLVCGPALNPLSHTSLEEFLDETLSTIEQLKLCFDGANRLYIKLVYNSNKFR